jgi:hypothetical protein
MARLEYWGYACPLSMCAHISISPEKKKGCAGRRILFSKFLFSMPAYATSMAAVAGSRENHISNVMMIAELMHHIQLAPMTNGSRNVR